MTKRENKNWIIAAIVAIALCLITKMKKKPQLTGTVEVGDGDFGDFGTDGFLDDYLQTGTVKTPNYVAGFTTPIMKNLTIKRPSLNQEIRKTDAYVQKSCSVCA